uniref:Uncharacterized protein n=1 Tax=Romanomermis culicivorax TaxID=13658 RepID=A0A915L731_ROMCU
MLGIIYEGNDFFQVEIQHLVTNNRRRAVDAMWDATLVHNVLEPRAWRRKVYRESDDFREILLYAIRRGYDGIDHIDNSQFTLAGAYLYSLTVITTI